MARYKRKGYREYRGRRPGSGSTVLKIVIALLVVLLAAGLVFTLFFGEYVEYTDDGVRVSWPWKEGKPSEDPAVSGALVVVTPEPTPEPTEEVWRPQVLKAVEVTALQVAEGDALQAVKEAGGNCMVVEMKTDTGKVNWSSAAALPDAVAQDVSAQIRALAEEEELYLVARVNCFRDQFLAADGVGGPLTVRSGVAWFDYYGMKWVSPADERVRSYLAALCLELAELGFDEILLECAGYPYFGETHVLATGELRPEDLSAPVGAFWQGLKGTLANEGVSLSMLVTQDMVVGADAYSGITPELLDQYADRVWVMALDGVDYGQGERTASLAGRLVLIGEPLEEGNWALMDGPMK